MKEELKIEITKKIGSADAPGLISKLEELGISDDALLYYRRISIPAALVKDIKSFQDELGSLSKVGRAFTVSVVDDRLQIDIVKMKPSSLAASRDTVFSASRRMEERSNPLGIAQENVQLPEIPRGSKVLDIGAGTGYISRKIKDTFSADVYALEPSFERSSDFDSCIEKLGEDHVEQLTLQEALTRFPEKYSQAFDVVCVFKYNVPYTQKEDFIRALSQVVKPDGIVYVTSVEPERFTYDRHSGEAPYLTDTFRKYFGNVSFATWRSFHGADQLMTLDSPKLELRDEISSEGPSHK